MSKIVKVISIVSVVVVIALVGVLVLGVAALAQGPGTSFGRMGIAGLQEGGFGGHGFARGGFGGGAIPTGEGRQQMLEALAEELGLSDEDIEAALSGSKTFFELMQEYDLDITEIHAAVETVRQSALQQAVEDGALTQEQADLMAERGFGRGGRSGFGASGMLGGFGGPGMLGGCGGELGGKTGPLAEYHDLALEIFAGELGLSVEEIEAGLAEGKTPYELMQEYDLDVAEVQAATEAAHQQILQQAVEDGVLTQEQADQISQYKGERGFGRGGHRGWGGFFGEPDAAQ
jgi:uncharacterized protein (DUF433 family)